MTATVQLAAPPDEGALLPVYRRTPLEIVRGEGVHVYDADGRAYLDFVSGIAVNALGYGDDGLRAAIEDALSSGVVHVSNLYHTTPARALANALAERSFASKVFFCNSGAEANEGAFKFARRWALGIGGPAKHEIIALRGSFHGRLFASLAATDRPSYRAPFRPLAGGVAIVERDLTALDVALDAETVAALIIEPVQGEGGVRVLEGDFLRALRDMTRSRDIALIFDEVQTGMGRTGKLFGYEHFGVKPDIMTLAKALGGGLPLGAMLAELAKPAANWVTLMVDTMLAEEIRGMGRRSLAIKCDGLDDAQLRTRSAPPSSSPWSPACARSWRRRDTRRWRTSAAAWCCFTLATPSAPMSARRTSRP